MFLSDYYYYSAVEDGSLNRCVRVYSPVQLHFCLCFFGILFLMLFLTLMRPLGPIPPVNYPLSTIHYPIQMRGKSQFCMI